MASPTEPLSWSILRQIHGCIRRLPWVSQDYPYRDIAQLGKVWYVRQAGQNLDIATIGRAIEADNYFAGDVFRQGPNKLIFNSAAAVPGEILLQTGIAADSEQLIIN